MSLFVGVFHWVLQCTGVTATLRIVYCVLFFPPDPLGVPPGNFGAISKGLLVVSLVIAEQDAFEMDWSWPLFFVERCPCLLMFSIGFTLKHFPTGPPMNSLVPPHFFIHGPVRFFGFALGISRRGGVNFGCSFAPKTQDPGPPKSYEDEHFATGPP